MSEHDFLVEDLPAFLQGLEDAGYKRSHSGRFDIFSRSFSDAVVKHYAHAASAPGRGPVRINVTYDLVKGGRPLRRLTGRLKALNLCYRHTLPGWKTRRPTSPAARRKIRERLLGFLKRHEGLASCFRYGGDGRTEGRLLFNLHVASTPEEQRVCLEFIKALADAERPHAIVRRRRQADKPLLQRNGWIKRFAETHKRLGWTPMEVSRSLQKELTNGTWNERAKTRYNIAINTICKIAGMKLPRRQGGG